jgi:hypothetical protein
MTNERDIDRVLDHWLTERPTQVADRVLDEVADRIARRSQQPAWRVSWRDYHVNAYLKRLLAAAAIIVIAVGGFAVLQPRSGLNVGGAPTPTPTAAPTAVGIRDVSDSGQLLDPGRWRFHVAAASSSLSVVADIPVGWLAHEGQRGIENVIATNSGPSGLAILFATPAHGVFSDPCHWDLAGTGVVPQDGDVKVGPKVADLVAALRVNTSFTSSTPSVVAFGSYTGQQLKLMFPADLDPGTCDRDPSDDGGTYRVMPDTIYSQGKANIWEMSIVDVAGTRFVAIIEYFPGTAPDKVVEARAIVDSFQFTPGP